MGRNLFRLIPLNNKYSGASWGGVENPGRSIAHWTTVFNPSLAGCRDKLLKSGKAAGQRPILMMQDREPAWEQAALSRRAIGVSKK